MTKRKHPAYYYDMYHEIMDLMDDQAGKPFDRTNYARQFHTVAGKYRIPAASYLATFLIVKDMVRKELPKKKPRQPELALIHRHA